MLGKVPGSPDGAEVHGKENPGEHGQSGDFVQNALLIL